MWGFKRSGGGGSGGGGRKRSLHYFQMRVRLAGVLKCNRGKLQVECIFLSQSLNETSMTVQMKINPKSDPQKREGKKKKQEPCCDLKINKQNLKTGSSSFPIPPSVPPPHIRTHQLLVHTLKDKTPLKHSTFTFSCWEKAIGIKLWGKCPNMFSMS